MISDILLLIAKNFIKLYNLQIMKKIALLILSVVWTINISAQHGWLGFSSLGKDIPQELKGLWVYDDDVTHFELWIAGEAVYTMRNTPCLVGCYKLVRCGKVVTDFAFDDEHIPDTVKTQDFPRGYFAVVNKVQMVYRDALTELGSKNDAGYDVFYYLEDSVSMEIEVASEYLAYRESRAISEGSWPKTPRNTWSKAMQEMWEEDHVFKQKGCSFPYFMYLKKVSNESPFKKKKS